MINLYVEYSEWKALVQTYGLTVYEQILTAESMHVWSGTTDFIFRSDVSSSDFADYSATFPSGRVEVTSEDAAILNIIQESLPVLTTGMPDSGNSSTTPLGISGVFTGTAFDTLDYPTAVLIVKPSHASSVGGLSFQWSPDGTNWDVVSNSDVDAGQGRGFHVSHRGRYFRVVYTNGPDAQSSFRLSVLHRTSSTGIISRPLSDALDDDNFAHTVRAVLSAKVPSGDYVSASFDSQGRLVVAPAGAISSLSGFSFGDVTLSSTSLAVVRRTTYNEQSSNAQRSISSSNANDSSAGTGARQVWITYYDSTGAGPFYETVALNGTTPVNTVATDICFIEKMTVTSVGSTGSNVGTITLFVSTDGGGGTIGTIAATNNQTFWAHHYVPVGKTCFITSFSASHNGTTVGSGGVYILRSRGIGVSTAVDKQISDFVRQYGQASNTVRNYGTPIEVAGPSRIIVYCTPEGSGTVVFRAAFDFYEQDT